MPRKGYRQSPEHRAKIGKAHKGKTLSPETRAKIGKANQGKTRSPETRAKISEANQGRTYTPETRAKISEANSGENHPMQGKTLSPKHRAKISEANQGKELSPETKDAISVAQTSKQRLLSQEDLEELLEETREKTPVFEARYAQCFGDIEAEGQLLKDVRELINKIPRMDKIEDGMTATTFQYYLDTLRTIRGRLKVRAAKRKRQTKPAIQ